MMIVRTPVLTRFAIGPLWFEVARNHMNRIQFVAGVYRREGRSFPRRDRFIKVEVFS